MATRTSYPHGTFCWADLSTSDVAAAKTFYGALFGWEAQDTPAGGGRFYTRLTLGGGAVAGAFTGDESVPPHWNCHITVDDADATTARAQELGATIIDRPFDVVDAGRMAVVRDPVGAVVVVWQARRVAGAGLVNAPGALSWNDLVTPRPDEAAAFYGAWLGWTFDRMPTGDDGPDYRVVRNGDRSNGGIMGQDGPSYWLAYFGTADADVAIARTRELGGALITGPVTMPAGRFAVLADPQEAAFAVVQATFDD